MVLLAELKYGLKKNAPKKTTKNDKMWAKTIKKTYSSKLINRYHRCF